MEKEVLQEPFSRPKENPPFNSVIIQYIIANFIENSKLNSDESVNKFMQMLRDLRAKGATVMFLNHTAKHDDSSAKGNNQLENYSDENFKVTRDYDIVTLAPKKYRIRGIKSTRLQIDIDTFEIKSICYDDKLFGLSDNEKMTLKMCVEILDQNESGLNQKELTSKLYNIKDENHFEFVEWGLRDETCDYLTLDDAKHLFVLLGKYITAVEMRI